MRRMYSGSKTAFMGVIDGGSLLGLGLPSLGPLVARTGVRVMR